MLENKTETLLAAINNHNSSVKEVNNAVNEFLVAFERSSATGREASALALCKALDEGETQYTPALANLLDHLLETELLHPEKVELPLIDFFARLLGEAEKIAAGFLVEMQKLPPVDEENEPDYDALFEEYLDRSAKENPAAAYAVSLFEHTWVCGISLFSVSPDARRRAQHLRQPAAAASSFIEGAHWLNLMLTVLDEEPFVAIELERQLGVIGKMSGVVENFQLHVLLMDLFPNGWFSGKNPPREVVANAKGEGGQTLDLTVQGRWNMYDWTIAEKGRSVADYAGTDLTQHWIWGEGKPDDIAVFEGRRVILLGKPTYERNWKAQRMFPRLKAELKVEQKLTKDEVRAFLSRLEKAPRS